MEIDKNRLLFNALLVMIKKSKHQVNISNISDIIGIDYLKVRDNLISLDGFPKPVIDSPLPLSKNWLLYDIFVWAIKQK